MRCVYGKKNSDEIWNVRYITAQSVGGNREGRRGRGANVGRNEARFCHRVLAAASLGIPNGDILILNFRREETRARGRRLRRRPHVEQEIGGGGIPRVGRQFVLEFSQRDHMHRLVIALQPSDALFVSPDAATIHAATADPIYQLLLVLARAGLAPEELE